MTERSEGTSRLVPGEIHGDGPAIEINVGAPRVSVEVVNAGDRPVQVGSHYHFAEANPALRFDRSAARGHRLDIPAGTSVRFEPGIDQTVTLVPIGGARIVAGLRGEVAGRLDAEGSGAEDDRPGVHSPPQIDGGGA